jgi:hypothetical protein
MNGINLSKIAAAASLGVASLGFAPSASAQSINELINRRQGKKNEWRNLAILGGAAGLVGLFTKNKTIAALGLGGGLYSLYRYEQDRKSQSKLAQQRAQLFGRRSFNYNGKRYVRRTRVKNGQRYYQFVRG